MLHRNNPELMSDDESYWHGKVKFANNNNIVQLREYIFLYKNFLDHSVLNKYTEMLKNISEKEWSKENNKDQFWNNKVSLEIIEDDIHLPILHLLAPNFWLFRNTSFVRLKTGESSSISSHRSYFAENDQRIIGHYKLALYLGDFEGGEICFPDQGIEYKPEPNDLLLFKIHKDYNHYTKEVKSGTRYAYQDISIYNPTYFMP